MAEASSGLDPKTHEPHYAFYGKLLIFHTLKRPLMNDQASTAFEILLLEDEPADAYLTRLAFEEGRILTRLHNVSDGREGLDFLQKKPPYQNAPRPDLILLDINMPRMNGHEFLLAIKADKTLKNIPVVVLTTSAVESDILDSYEKGAAGYISKPIDVSEFVNIIRRLEDYWLTLVHLPGERKK